MRRKSIYTPVIFFLFLLIPAHFPSAEILAQGNGESGFILDTKGDRVEGFFPEMDAYDRTRHLLFIPEGKTEPQRLGLDDFTYAETISGEKRKPFPQSVSGSAIGGFIGTKMYDTDIKLYSARTEPGVQHFYVINRDGAAIYLSPQRYQIQLRSVFGDCSGVVRGYSDSDTRYNESYMNRMFREYDRCMVSKDEVKEYRVRYGVIGGLTRGKTQTESMLPLFRESEFEYLNSFAAGIFVDIPLQRSSFFVRPEISYQEIVSSAFAQISSNFRASSQVKMQMLTLDIPIRYEYGFYTIRPYVSGGFSLALLLDDSAEYTTNDVAMEIGSFDRRFHPGIHLAAGARLHEVAKGKDLFTEFRFNYRYAEEPETNLISGVQAISFLLGISF